MTRWRDMNFGLLVPRPLTSLDMGQQILSLLQDLLPTYMPELYGNVEPLRNRCDPCPMDDLLSLWRDHFFWRSKGNVAEGSAWLSRTPTHAYLYISGTSKNICETNAIEFIRRAAVITESDYAYIHIFTKAEFTDKTQEMYMPYRQGIVTNDLRKYLPSLCWGTVFGPPYVDFFGRQTLLSAPAHVVTELGKKAIYLQASESLRDLQTHYGNVEVVRQRIKEHLNHNAFYDPFLGQAHIYDTPLFSGDKRELPAP